MNVGERLADMMQQHGVASANQLASLSGVSQTMISKILRGESSPTTQTLELLCAALGVTLSDFYSAEAKSDGDGLAELREEFRRRPELRLLFSATKKATKDDLLKTVRIIEALKDDGRDDD